MRRHALRIRSGMRAHLDPQWISDDVPTLADEVITKDERRLLRALHPPTEEGAFAEASIELYVDREAIPR